MLLWISLALMTGAAVLSVLWPLSRASAASEPDSDVPFYKAQLAEIDRDRERGLLDAPEAEAARVESGRRLLRAAGAVAAPMDATSEPALRRRRAASALSLSVVPIVGLALYGGLGSPELTGRRAVEPPASTSSETAPSGLASALARVEDHLAANPNDVRGWDVIAPIYLRTGRFDDAARAFGQARRLGGDTAERLLGEGEALVSAAGGTVDAPARELFRRVIERDPASPPARYYLALGAEQAGDREGASAGYRALLAASKPDAAWVPLVRTRLARLGGGPAVATLPDGAVTPEIAAMVSGLDTRLARGGGSEAEWSRLIRSFAVLGRRDDARDRLGRARTALAGDPEAAPRLDTLAEELGLGAVGASR